MVHCDTCISVLLSKCYRTKPTKLSAIFFEFWIEVADVQEQISFSENSKNIYLRDIIRYHPVAKYMIDLQLEKHRGGDGTYRTWKHTFISQLNDCHLITDGNGNSYLDQTKTKTDAPWDHGLETELKRRSPSNKREKNKYATSARGWRSHTGRRWPATRRARAGDLEYDSTCCRICSSAPSRSSIKCTSSETAGRNPECVSIWWTESAFLGILWISFVVSSNASLCSWIIACYHGDKLVCS